MWYNLEAKQQIGSRSDALTSSGLGNCIGGTVTMSDHTTNTPSQVKTCTKCGETKPATTEYFYRQKDGALGLRPDCKICMANRGKEYRQNNAERIANYMSQWRTKHIERELDRSRQYQRANRNQVLANRREKYAENPDLARAQRDLKRAKKAGAPGEYTADDVKARYKAQAGKCYYCSQDLNNEYQIDHVIPLSRGGSNWPENIVVACKSCNSSKRNKLLSEWSGPQ